MSADALKRLAAQAALRLVAPLLRPTCLLGVGTGSTTNHFIDGLGALRGKFRGAVSSSAATTARLEAQGVPMVALSEVAEVAVYVDGADEVAADRALVKGGGGALTREKIIAACAERFVCVVDETKLPAAFGAFPLPVEALPAAEALVARRLAALGGQPLPRRGVVTDNGNMIFDVRGLPMGDPPALEAALNAIPGVVECGLFTGALRPDVVLVGASNAARGGAPGVRHLAAPDYLAAPDCPTALRQAAAGQRF